MVQLYSKKTLISISLILIIIMSLMSYNLYTSSSRDKNGVKLGCFDTIKNILGILPDIVSKTSNNIVSTSSDMIKDTTNLIKDTAVNTADLISTTTSETADVIIDNIKLPKIVSVDDDSYKKEFDKEIPEQEKLIPDPTEIENKQIRKKPKKTSKKEVFNIDNNAFTFDEAAMVCKAYNSELATYDQLLTAHKKGANWCNYGWSANGMALYPIQDKFHKKLKNSSSKYKNSCGKPGVNGGVFQNKELKFGVNCYGVRPRPDEDKIVYNDIPDTSIPELKEEINFEKEFLEEIKNKIDKGIIEVRPFSNNKWSKYSDKKSSYLLTPKYQKDKPYQKKNINYQKSIDNNIEDYDLKTRNLYDEEDEDEDDDDEIENIQDETNFYNKINDIDENQNMDLPLDKDLYKIPSEEELFILPDDDDKPPPEEENNDGDVL